MIYFIRAIKGKGVFLHPIFSKQNTIESEVKGYSSRHSTFCDRRNSSPCRFPTGNKSATQVCKMAAMLMENACCRFALWEPSQSRFGGRKWKKGFTSCMLNRPYSWMVKCRHLQPKFNTSGASLLPNGRKVVGSTHRGVGMLSLWLPG